MTSLVHLVEPEGTDETRSQSPWFPLLLLLLEKAEDDISCLVAKSLGEHGTK